MLQLNLLSFSLIRCRKLVNQKQLQQKNAAIGNILFAQCTFLQEVDCKWPRSSGSKNVNIVVKEWHQHRNNRKEIHPPSSKSDEKSWAWRAYNCGLGYHLFADDFAVGYHSAPFLSSKRTWYASTGSATEHVENSCSLFLLLLVVIWVDPESQQGWGVGISKSFSISCGFQFQS